MIRPVDQDARTTAWQCFNDNVSVTAGAGTGKTRVLVDRYLAWILGQAWTDERWNNAAEVATSIVAITFTDKAAGEMAERVTRSLRRIAGLDDGGLEEREATYVDDLGEQIAAHWNIDPNTVLVRAQQLVQQVHRLEISTIHSFAINILRRYPLVVQIRPDFQVDIDQRLQKDAVVERLTDTVKTALRGPQAAEMVRILSAVTMDDLTRLALAWLRTDYDGSLLDGDDMTGTSEDCRAMLTDLLGAKDHVATNSMGRLERLESALRTLSDWITLHGDALQIDPRAALSPAVANALRALRKDKLVEYPPATVRKKTSINWDGFHTRAVRVTAFARELERADPALIRSIVQHLEPVVTSVRSQCMAAGILSFDDLLRLTASLLDNRPAIATAVAERYGQVLVDEFQDTSPIQCALMRAIERAAPDPILFVVGDPKQSIYAFRGADLAAYEDFVETLGTHLQLTSNFRSQAHLVRAVNEAFDRLFVPVPRRQPAAQPLAPTIDPITDMAAVQLWDVVSGTDQTPTAEDARITEANALVNAIQELDRTQPSDGPRWSRYAIISRVQTAATTIVDALEAAGIPCAVDGDKEFYRRQEVLDTANLLRVVCDASDATAWIGVLRSPIGALPDRLLLDLATEGFFAESDPKEATRRACESLNEGDPDVRHLQRIEQLVATIEGLREGFLRGPLDEWLELLHGELPLWELYGSQYLGERKVANIHRVLCGFVEMAIRGETSLADWLENEAQNLVGARNETESALSDDTTDAVRILSIHKSKGLQFDHVFVPRLDWTAGNTQHDNVGLIRRPGGWILQLGGVHSWGMGAWEKENTAREEAEVIRLLYVACTRARKTLTLSGAKTSKSSRSMLPLVRQNMLQPDEDQPWIAQHSIAPTGDDTPTLKRPHSVEGTESWVRHAEAWWQRRREDAALVSAQRLVGTATAQTISTEPMGGGHRDGRSIGVEVHEVLEQWDIQTDNVETASAEAMPIIQTFLQSPLASRVRASKRQQREVPFVGLDSTGNPVTGTIDLLMETEQGWIVVDYKTNRVRDQAHAKELAESYRHQAELYTHAIQQALNTTKVSCELWFLRGPFVVTMT